MTVYSDYVLIIKRCRNAVYHYQKDILDKRVENAVRNKELLIWSGALLDEFVRFLFLYPVSLYGISKDSMHLQEKYLDLIGWVPKNANLMKWFEILVAISLYYQGSSVELLDRNPVNDLIIDDVIVKLKSLEINPYISELSRL